MARRQAGLSGEDGARGRNCKPFPGGFGHHVCRHYDRHARCSLQPGQAPAGDPRQTWRSLRETWSEAAPGDARVPRREPRWNAGRRAHRSRCAPQRKLRRLRDCVLRRSASFLSVRSFVRSPRRAWRHAGAPGAKTRWQGKPVPPPVSCAKRALRRGRSVRYSKPRAPRRAARTIFHVHLVPPA